MASGEVSIGGVLVAVDASKVRVSFVLKFVYVACMVM
mgnify:CR=1 FL=1